MASRSATTHVNVYEPNDYSIVLGDSLRDPPTSRSRYLQLRYNWEPEGGFQYEKGTIKRTSNELRLRYQDANSSQLYGFEGFATKDKEDVDSSQLILVFDESRSVFVLERVSGTINFNVTSASGHSSDELRRHRQLRRSPSVEDNGDRSTWKSSDGEDEMADPENPFDFRHFLAEAKETAEKSALPTGNRTPLSVMASPSGGNRPYNNSASFKPTSASVASTKTQAAAKSGAKPTSSATAAPKKTAPKKRQGLTTSKGPAQPLSKAKVSDSDDELSDTVVVEPREGRGHKRNISASKSPNIVISDGGLTIDMGSPVQEPKRHQYKIDPEAFRSQTHTPIFNNTSNRRPPPRAITEDVEMKDPEPSDPEDDEDDDVEVFNLDGSQSRRNGHQMHQADEAPTPDRGAADEDEEEDDDALAKELEAALYGEEDTATNDNAAGPEYGHVEDDESEVSEEE